MDFPNFPTTNGKRPWNPRRHREAQYVASVVGISKLTADKLIRRARTAGMEYDLIDWDSMQGGDLCYDELVWRLEEQVGKTWTKSSFEMEIRLQQENHEELRQNDETDIE